MNKMLRVSVTIRGLLWLMLIFTASHSNAEVEEPSAAVPAPFIFPKGDVQNCPQTAATVMEVLPTYGWDNLRNIPMKDVLDVTYNKCKLTADRKFIIPDDVTDIPIKSSRMNMFSELIDHWSNYTSIVAKSVNVGFDVSLPFVSISGSFSYSHQDIKQHQIEDRSVTTRVQLRYILHKIQSPAIPSLDEGFKQRLYDIALSIQNNDTDRAAFQSDLLVRDFGTHYITSVDAGGVLVQEDQVLSKYVSDYHEKETVIKAAASAHFLSLFGISISGQTSTTDIEVNTYVNNRAYSNVYTHGGPSYRSKFQLNDWIDGLSNDMVAIDRSGEPLFYLITPNTLPKLPWDTVYGVSNQVKKSIKKYYEHNVYFGCTDQQYQNFKPSANIDDGSCDFKGSNFSFGGIFQTCSGDRCQPGMSQVNPHTGGYSCAPQYATVPLHSGFFQVCWRHCSFWRCRDSCENLPYTIYWCASTTPSTIPTGYLFGGLYTPATPNPVTGAASCPPKFMSLTLSTRSTDLYVCISDDYEWGFPYSVPFAGFSSCSAGNPLAIAGVEKVQSNVLLETASGQQTLTGFSNYVLGAGPSAWPRACPSGYNQHLAAVLEGCEVNYCVKVHALAPTHLPEIRLPPYVSPPQTIPNTTQFLRLNSGVIFKKSADNNTWVVAQEEEYTDLSGATPPPSSGTSGLAVGMTVLFTTLVGALAIALFVIYKQRRGDPFLWRTRDARRKDGPAEPLLQGEDGHEYGAIGGQQEPQAVVVSS